MAPSGDASARPPAKGAARFAVWQALQSAASAMYRPRSTKPGSAGVRTAISRVRVGQCANNTTAVTSTTTHSVQVSREPARAALMECHLRLNQRTRILEIPLADGPGRPIGQCADEACRVVPVVLRKCVGTGREYVGNIPRLQIAVERGGARIVAHDCTAAGVCALVLRNVVVRAGFFGIAGHGFGLQSPAHVERLAHQILRSPDLVVVPVECCLL